MADLALTLLNGYDDLTGDQEFAPFEPRTAPRAAVVVALANHVHESVRFLLPAMQTSLTTMHAPLIRGVLESMVTVLYLDKSEGAAEMVTHARHQSLQSLHLSLDDALTITEVARILDLWNEDQPGLAAGSPEDLLRERCDWLGLSDFYTLHRRLSDVTKPSVQLADEYLRLPGSGGQPFTVIKAPPNLHLHTLYCWVLCVSLVWTGRSIDRVLRSTTRRPQLQEAARSLGVTADLPSPRRLATSGV